MGDVCGTSWLSWLDRPGVAPGQQVAMTALVPLVVYFGSGRWFVRGIAAGAVKG